MTFYGSDALQDRLPTPPGRALARGSDAAVQPDRQTCSDIFAVVLIAALAYPVARLASGSLVYLCVAIILVGLPLSITYVDRVKFFTVGFLALAIAFEALTAALHQTTTGDFDLVRYSIIGCLLWSIMLVGNLGANHEGRVRLDYLLAGATLFYLLVFVAVRREGVCPPGQLCADQFAQLPPREQSIFEHPNELGLFIAGLLSFISWLFRDRPLRQHLPGILLGAGLVYFLVKSDSATSAVAAAAVIAACYLKPARFLINVALAALILALFVAQIFLPSLGMEISGLQGSFWWRFVVADEINRQLGDALVPLRYDLFSIFKTWLHSKYLDIYVIFGLGGVTAFAVGAVLSVLVYAKYLSSTVLAAIVISSLVQPFGAFPGPFLLWCLLYTLILSSELREATRLASFPRFGSADDNLNRSPGTRPL